ncbi:hypothetical protein BaOVIS_034810 [Babesia ovis]|uniref:Uncharacterized protein n=1 Tax=Babesia ovis TaxID=5869 RepID=A0A9W5TEY5_BABOV|nr:hypothetical protein BaOVIS_034810 [Babesia ovis]
MAGEFRPPAPGEVGVFVWDRRQCNHVQQGGNPFSVHMLQPDHLQHVRPHQRTIIPNMPQPQHMNVGYQRGPNGSMTPQANEPPNVISARNALNKEITEANRNYNILSNKVAQLRDKYESAQRTLSTTHERHAYEIARRNKDAAEKEYDKAAKDLGMQHVRAELSIQKANASLQLAIARWHLNVIKSIEQTENTKQESQVASLSSSAQEKRHTFETTANPHEKERARQEMVKAEGLFNEASEKLNHHKSYFHQAIQKESANVNLRIAIHRLDSTRLDFMLKDQQAVSENTKIVMDIDRLENEKVREVNPEKIAAYENEIRYKRSLLDDATAKLDYERYKAEFHLSTIKTDVDWRRALLVLNTLRYDTLVERQTIENHIKTQILHIARLNYNKSVERDPNKLAALEHDISTKNADVGNQKLILNHKIHHANFEDRRAFTYAQWLEYIKIREQMRYDAFIANEKETEGIKETEKQVYTLQSHRPDPNNKEEMRTWTTHLATYEDMLANQRFGQSISKDLATLQYNYTQADAALHDIIHLKAMRELEYENITVTIKKECELLQNETAELKISLSHENNSALIRELSDQLGKKESDLQEKTTILNMIGDIAKQDMLVLDAHITWLKHAKEVEDKKYQGALNTREDRVKLHELVVKFNRLKLEQPDPNNYPLIEQWRRNVHSAEVDLNNRTKEVDGKIQNQFAETKVAEDLAHAAKGKYDEAKNIRLQLIEETQKNEAYANKLPKNIMTAEIKVDPVSLPETNINGEDSQQTLPNNTESTNQSKNENTRNEHSNKPPQDEHKPGIECTIRLSHGII